MQSSDSEAIVRRFEAPELYDFPASCVEEADTVLISFFMEYQKSTLEGVRNTGS